MLNRSGPIVGFCLALAAGASVPAAGEEAELMSLSEKETQYLQDAEHLGGFVLGDLTFPLIKKALVAADAAAVAEFLAPGFEARDFDPEKGATTQFPFASFRTWREGTDPLASLGRDAFVESWLKRRRELKEVRAAGVKVIRMSPVKHGELGGPWAGTMKIFLSGRALDGSLAHWVTQYRCRILEISDDTPKKRGWLLGLEAYLGEHSRSGDFLTADMTAETGIDTKRLFDTWTLKDKSNVPFLTGGVYLTDYDQDGRMDMLLTDLNGLAMYQGQAGGRFADVTDKLGLPRSQKALGGVFADLDGDGFEDLLLGPLLYRNEGGKQFRILPPVKHNLRLEPQSFKYAVADYDRDGKLDLYVVGLRFRDASASQRKWIGKNHIAHNQLWRNLGDWRFENVTAKAGVGGTGSSVFAAVWYDANGDSRPDILTANEFGTNDYYLNQGDGTFKVGELPGGYGGFSMGIALSDIDNDGFGDPYIANMYSKAGERIVHNLDPGLYSRSVYELFVDFVTGDDLYHNQGNGKYQRIGQTSGINDVGWAFGTGYGDLNSDGLPDLYSPVGFQSITRDKPDG